MKPPRCCGRRAAAAVAQRSLGLAARAGDAKTVRFLLDAGANVFERGYAGRQPVHVAAHNNNGGSVTGSAS